MIDKINSWLYLYIQLLESKTPSFHSSLRFDVRHAYLWLWTWLFFSLLPCRKVHPGNSFSLLHLALWSFGFFFFKDFCTHGMTSSSFAHSHIWGLIFESGQHLEWGHPMAYKMSYTVQSLLVNAIFWSTRTLVPPLFSLYCLLKKLSPHRVDGFLLGTLGCRLCNPFSSVLSEGSSI